MGERDLDVVAEAIDDVSADSGYTPNELTEAAVTLATLGIDARTIAEVLPSVAFLAESTTTPVDTTAPNLVASMLHFSEIDPVNVGEAVGDCVSLVYTAPVTLDELDRAVSIAAPAAAWQEVSFEELVVYVDSAARMGRGRLLGRAVRAAISADGDREP